MRAAIYLRVSTDEQTTDNQERELRATAERAGHEVVAVYRDAGISGAKGRDKRPGFDAMHKDAARHRFDIVMAWSVDRLGRSLQDLIAFMQELRSLKIDLFLHQQGPRHHDARRQDDVSAAWLIRGVRARHDPGACQRRHEGCGQALWSATPGT
jgi:DNA invertase Pin-like site-specific DNA recombinase